MFSSFILEVSLAFIIFNFSIFISVSSRLDVLAARGDVTGDGEVMLPYAMILVPGLPVSLTSYSELVGF
jgi:hypothetical protein